MPTLRSMLEEAMEQKAQLQAEKEDCTRLRQGLALTWVPDAAVHKCLNCEVAFSIRKWKNHCRCSAISRPFLPASACLLLRVVHGRDVAGIAAVSFAGTAPAASWRFGASARRCSSRCSCFVSRAQNCVDDFDGFVGARHAFFVRELGYNYEVPVSGTQLRALLMRALTAELQVCDHCHNLLSNK